MTAAAGGGRPVSVTIIAWLAIVTSLGAVAISLFLWGDPEIAAAFDEGPFPRPVELAIFGLHVATGLAAGVGMLKGLNWARLLFIGIEFAMAVREILTLPFDGWLLAGVLLLALFACLLFGRKADAWFGRSYGIF